MMHVLTSTGVAIPTVDKYHNEIRPLIKTIKALGDEAERVHGLTWGMEVEGAPVLETLQKFVTEYGREGSQRPFSSGVYSIPFLTPEYCDALLTEVAVMSFEVNPDEEAEVQIPEITLADTCPTLHSCLHGLFNNVVNPLTKVLYQLEQARMSSIQFAQYTPENTSHGNCGTTIGTLTSPSWWPLVTSIRAVALRLSLRA